MHLSDVIHIRNISSILTCTLLPNSIGVTNLRHTVLLDTVFPFITTLIVQGYSCDIWHHRYVASPVRHTRVGRHAGGGDEGVLG